MSDKIRPDFSIGPATSLKLGVYPPGKIYLVIQGCGSRGELIDPIVCKRAIPSSFKIS